jgi:hypothetical protein
MDWIVTVAAYVSVLGLLMALTFYFVYGRSAQAFVAYIYALALLAAGSAICAALAMVARSQQVEWARHLLIDRHALVWLPLPVLLAWVLIGDWRYNRAAIRQERLEQMHRPPATPTI